MYSTILLATFFASTAILVREGLWSNTITFINIMFSGLVAFGLYAPLSVMVDEALDGQYTYLIDFLMIWALFCVTMIICRIAAGSLSKTRVRFKPLVERIIGGIMTFLTAEVLTGFVLATLHTVPMGPTAFGLDDTNVATVSHLMRPDAAWLSYLERVDKRDGFGSGGTEDFDAQAFVDIYTDHRTKLDAASGLRVDR